MSKFEISRMKTKTNKWNPKRYKCRRCIEYAELFETIKEHCLETKRMGAVIENLADQLKEKTHKLIEYDDKIDKAKQTKNKAT